MLQSKRARHRWGCTLARDALPNARRPIMSGEARYDGLEYWGPYSSRSIDAILAAASLDETTLVLDVGCGQGALLARAAQRYRARVAGIDASPEAIERARALLGATLGAPRPDERLFVASFDDAAVESVLRAHGRAALVVWIGGPRFGDDGRSIDTTVAALDRLRAPAGSIVTGAPYWRRLPPDEYFAQTGLAPDALDRREDVVAALAARGLRPAQSFESDRAAWVHFEDTLVETARRRVERDDTRAAKLDLQRRERWAEAQHRWGIDAMTFVIDRFVAAER